MKVTGPKTGIPGATPDIAPAVGETGVEAPVDSATRDSQRTGQSFAERVTSSQRTGDVAGGGGVSTLTDDIAAELKAGTLPPDAAVEKLLERVLQHQLGADAAPALRGQVRAALQDALENDPLLAETLRRFVPVAGADD